MILRIKEIFRISIGINVVIVAIYHLLNQKQWTCWINLESLISGKILLMA